MSISRLVKGLFISASPSLSLASAPTSRLKAQALLCTSLLLGASGCVTPSEEEVLLAGASAQGGEVIAGAEGGVSAGVAHTGGAHTGGAHIGGDEAGVEGGTGEGGVMFANLPAELTVATYNVQNLFDLIDDPEHLEYEYTPSAGQWNQQAFQARLNALARVLKEINADVITLQEVESLEALSALAETLRAQGGPDYPHLHVVNSQDPRGISLAVMSRYPFDRAIGRPINADFSCANGTQLTGNRPEARPIYEVSLWGVGDEAALTLLVNHWKSKAADPEPCEVAEHHERAATQLSGLIEEWLMSVPSRAVVALGDFNAEESEPAMRDALGASVSRDQLRFAHDLYNLWGELGVGQAGVSDNATNSTYYYNNAWRRLDHIALTRGMIDGRSPWQLERFEQVRPAFIMRDGRPYRWDLDAREGFSDHFPIKVTLRRR